MIKFVNYTETLDGDVPSPVLVRKTWENENGNISVQTIQRIEVPVKENTNLAVAFMLGDLSAGTHKVTAIMTTTPEVFQKVFGNDDYENDYADLGEAPLLATWPGFHKIDPTLINIEITDSFTPNPYVEDADANLIINPTTNEPILLEGRKIYRHTELVVRKPNHQFATSVESVQNGRKWSQSTHRSVEKDAIKAKESTTV